MGKLEPLFEEEHQEQVERAKVALTELKQGGKAIPPDLDRQTTAGGETNEDSADDSGATKSVKHLPTRKNFANNLRNSSNPNSIHDSMRDGSDWHPRRSHGPTLSAVPDSGSDRSAMFGHGYTRRARRRCIRSTISSYTGTMHAIR